MNDDINALGPLKGLVGVWQGDKGDDTAPADDRVSAENSLYRESIAFEPIGEVNNHEQSLYGLRYAAMAWRLGEDNAFHEEVGYWLWDDANRQVMKSFSAPRGYTVIAGGTAEPDAQTFKLMAELGSETYGILSNQFLAEEFKTVRYEIDIEIYDDDSFSYAQAKVMQTKGQDDLFHHRSSNTLTRVGQAISA